MSNKEEEKQALQKVKEHRHDVGEDHHHGASVSLKNTPRPKG